MTPIISRIIGYPARWLQRKRTDRLRARWLDPARMEEYHRHNLATLARVPKWIDDEAMRSSVFEYGAPEVVRPLIDLPIGQDYTYTDALLSLTSYLSKPVSYLEIGVSVGKTFLQMGEALRDAQLTAFDIEEIGPVLKSHFQLESKTEWPTAVASLKKAHSSLGMYAPTARGNRIAYLSGDVYDEESWRHLEGRKFNLIFSDAFHSADALIVEYEMLAKYGLLDDDQLIMMWDDLGGSMTEAFQRIAGSLTRSHGLRRGGFFVTPLRGWLGENWAHHQVGFFISL